MAKDKTSSDACGEPDLPQVDEPRFKNRAWNFMEISTSGKTLLFKKTLLVKPWDKPPVLWGSASRHEICIRGLENSLARNICSDWGISITDLCEQLGVGPPQYIMDDKRNPRLIPYLSEVLLRFEEASSLAAETLESPESAMEWMFSETPSLHGKRPCDLLTTGFGFEELKQLLGRIEHSTY